MFAKLSGHRLSPITMKNDDVFPLQPHELEFAAWFLEDAGADFQDHSADETFMPASAGMLAVAEAIRAEFGDDAPDAVICRLPGSAEDVVQFYTSQAMAFCARRCRELAGSTDGQGPDAAELALMAQLLDLAGQDHEHVAHDVCFDLTLDVTADNRSMFGAAVDHYLERARAQPGRGKRVGKDVAGTALAIRAVLFAERPDATIDIPDYWLMFYLARRCEALAKAG